MKKIINVCCNLKRGLYLGTKKNKRKVILRDGESITEVTRFKFIFIPLSTTFLVKK